MTRKPSFSPAAGPAASARCEQAGPSAPRAGRPRRGTFTVVLACALALPAMAMATAAPARADDLSITNAWIRVLMPQRPAAGYFTLSNSGASARELVGAASPDCQSVMLHQSRSTNNVETMAMVDAVKVPAHGAVTFAPGGYHLMCMQPSAAMVPGHTIPMTLRFKDGATLSAGFTVHNAMGK